MANERPLGVNTWIMNRPHRSVPDYVANGKQGGVNIREGCWNTNCVSMRTERRQATRKMIISQMNKIGQEKNKKMKQE